MPESFILVNTSPLLYLHQIGYLEILKNLYKIITVPEAVVEELEVGARQGINVPNIKTLGWISLKSVQSVSLIPTFIDLDKGEAEVIALGLENPASLLILDDQLGRRIANLYQLKYTGTLGVLVKAKQLGYLSSIKPIIQMLRHQGMWLTDQIVNDILQLAGESESI
jgi:predicted nucleic acid-binding protein